MCSIVKKLAMAACAAVFVQTARAEEIGTTEKLIFPGVTLDELGGLTCTVKGSYLPDGKPGEGYFGSRNGNTQEVQMQAVDGPNVKVAILELTEKEDGIWVKGTGGKYVGDTNRLGTDINISPTADFGYGAYKAVDLVRTPGQKLLRGVDYVTTKTLLWRNRKLSELIRFSAYSDGKTWCPAGEFTVCNVVRGENTVTAQFQMQHDTSVKGVVFEFSQEGSDVYGTAKEAHVYNNGIAGECDLTKGNNVDVNTYYKPRYIGATARATIEVPVDGDTYCLDQSAEATIYKFLGTQDATFTIAEKVELRDVILDFSAYEGRARLVVASPAEAAKLTIRSVDTICYTDDLEVAGSPTPVGGSKAVEYAGAITFTGKYENPVNMVFSGDALIDTTPKEAHFLGSQGAFVIADGTTTLNGKTFLSHASGNPGAKIRQTGGLVTATDGGYFYYGGYAGTIRIDCLGGRWEAPINPHSGSSLPNYEVTITVGKGAVFAPKNLTFEGGGLTSSYASNSKIVLENGATFEVPDQKKIGNWVKIVGAGTILVKSGVSFDYSSWDLSAFHGKISVEEGATAIGVYTGDENFYSDRTAIPEASAWLGGTHKYGIDKRMADAKGTFKGLTFCGNVTLENKSGNPEFLIYTRTDEPLNISGGVFDGGNVLLAPCHEEGSSKTYAINLFGDGELTNMRLRWGYWWKSQTTMTLKDASSFTGSLTPMKNGTMMPDSTFTVNIEDAATFAPKAFCAENGTVIDGVSGPCFVNLNSAAATYVLPEVVPVWVANTLSAGTVTMPEDRKVTVLGAVDIAGPVTIEMPAGGFINFTGALTGADNLTVDFTASEATVISPVKLTNVRIVSPDKRIRLIEKEEDGKFIYHTSSQGLIFLMY